MGTGPDDLTPIPDAYLYRSKWEDLKPTGDEREDAIQARVVQRKIDAGQLDELDAIVEGLAGYV